MQKVIAIDSSSEDDALEKVIADYRSGNIILDAENFVDYEIKAVVGEPFSELIVRGT